MTSAQIKTERQRIIETFAELGMPGNEGLCFTITSKWVRANFQCGSKGLMRHLPRPDYEHRIFFDAITDCLLVVRADKKGKYTELEAARAPIPGLGSLSSMERVR